MAAFFFGFLMAIPHKVTAKDWFRASARELK